MTLTEVFLYVRRKYQSLLCRIQAIESGESTADGNGIYSSDDTVPDSRTVTLAGLFNILGAGAGRQFYVEVGDAIDNLTEIDMTATEMTVGQQTTGADSTLVFNSDGITANNFVNILNYTPSSAADAAGIEGSICYDDDFIYVKTNSGWARSALTLIP